MPRFQFAEFDQAAPAANSSVLGVASPIPTEGVLVSIQVIETTGALVPPGRYYARVVLVSTSTGSAPVGTDTIMVLWEGYIPAIGSISRPNIPVSGSQSLILQIWAGTNGAATDQFRVRALICDEPADAPGGGWIFSQPAGTGPGELIALIRSQPGAGADFARLAVPAGVRRKFRSFRSQLATAVAAANRLPQLTFDDGTATHIYSQTPQPGSIPASQTVNCSWSFGGSDPVVANLAGSAGIGDVVQPTLHAWSTVTLAIQAADQWTAGQYLVEEWAMPVP